MRSTKSVPFIRTYREEGETDTASFRHNRLAFHTPCFSEKFDASRCSESARDWHGGHGL